MEMDTKGTAEGRKKVRGLWYKMSPGAQNVLSKMSAAHKVSGGLKKKAKARRTGIHSKGSSGRAMGVRGIGSGGE